MVAGFPAETTTMITMAVKEELADATTMTMAMQQVVARQHSRYLVPLINVSIITLSLSLIFSSFCKGVIEIITRFSESCLC